MPAGRGMCRASLHTRQYPKNHALTALCVGAVVKLSDACFTRLAASKGASIVKQRQAGASRKSRPSAEAWPGPIRRHEQ